MAKFARFSANSLQPHAVAWSIAIFVGPAAFLRCTVDASRRIVFRAAVAPWLADRAKSLVAGSSGIQVAFGAGSTAKAYRFFAVPISRSEVVADEKDAPAGTFGGSATDLIRVVPDDLGVMAAYSARLALAGRQVVIVLFVDPHLSEIPERLVDV